MKRLLAASLALLCALACTPALAGSAGNFPINLDCAPTTFMTVHALVVADAKQGACSLTDIGTGSKVLIGNASGDPTWGAVPSGAFGPLTGDVTTSGYVATLAKISSLTASRVVAVDASKVPTSSFASSVLLNSLTDPTGTGVAVFGTSPTIATPTINIADNALTIQDDADSTKKAVFQLSSITTGTTRTYTWPNSSMTVLGRADTATVSNKTLDNTNTVTLKDTLFTLQDDGDTTKQAVFQLSGLTTATTRTYTLPDATGTIDETANTATLSNKSMSGSANTFTNIPNSALTNSSITINGSAISLGGSKTLSLASADFANQGTTHTVLHGNGSGNPSFGAVDLTADVTGICPVANGCTGLGTLTSNAILYGNGTGTVNLLGPVVGATRKFVVGVSLGAPSYDLILNADLPLATTATRGAIIPSLCAGHFFSVGIDPGTASPSCARPDASDLTGLAAIATSGSASDLSAGTVPAARGGAGTINGILKANGSGVVSLAVSNTDYLPVSNPVFTSTLSSLAGSITLTAGQFFSGGNNATVHGSAGGLTVDGSDAKYRTMQFSTVGSAVWDIGTDNTAQSLTRTGNNLEICEYSNVAAFLDCPVSIARATGVVTIIDGVSITGAGGTCTNQFVRSIAVSLIATCAAVANADLSNSSVTISGHSLSLGGTLNLACADLSNAGTVCTQNTGTSGANVGLLNAALTFSGADTFNSSLTAAADFYMGGAISPTTISASVNDYNPGTLASATTIRVSANVGPFAITGLAGGAANRVVEFWNVGTNDFLLSEQSGSSSAANRFELGLTTDLTVKPNGTVFIQYDLTTARWRRVGGGQVPTPGALQLGGVVAGNCPSGAQYVQGVVSDGTLNCGTIAFSVLVSTPTTLAGYAITDALKTTNNLSDVSNPVTSQSNLAEPAKYLTAQFDKSNTTVAGVSDLQITPASSTDWAFDLYLSMTVDATSGFRLRMGNSGGTITATSIDYTVIATCRATGVVTAKHLTDVTTNFTLTGCADVIAEVHGHIEVNAGALFGPLFALSSGTTTGSILKDSYAEYKRTG